MFLVGSGSVSFYVDPDMDPAIFLYGSGSREMIRIRIRYTGIWLIPRSKIRARQVLDSRINLATGSSSAEISFELDARVVVFEF